MTHAGIEVRRDESMALTGPEKAVLMLLTLDEATAAPVVAELDGNELRKLREVATMMRSVPAHSLSDVYGEFVGRGQELIAVPHGGVRYLQRLTSRALGDARSQEVFGEGPKSPFERLAHAAPLSVAAVLENEHPQLVAAILSQLDETRSARILEGLPEELQLSVLERLATMTEVPAGLLETVATAVSSELPATEAEAAISVDGVARTAGLVRKLGKEIAAGVLSRMDDANSEIAAAIRAAMFTFEDLKTLDAKALRTLLKEVQKDRLVLALKTASAQLREYIFSNMSQRAAELVRDDLELMGAVRLVEVESAQREIVETALRLEAEGAIQLWGEGNDMV